MPTTAAARAAPPPAVGVGEAASFDDVFGAYHPFVWRTLRRLGVHDADAEDVCQEVFVAVHRKLAEFEGRSSLRTWVYGICIHAASNHRRRGHVRREVATEQVPDPGVEADQHDRLERRRALELLDRMLEELDEDRRGVFVLFEIEQLPMTEVAHAVGCPLQTAYSRLHAARKQLEAAAKRHRARNSSP